MMGLISTAIGRCWDLGTGFRTDFSKLLECLDVTKARSGLYPLLHLALRKDGFCLATWRRVVLVKYPEFYFFTIFIIMVIAPYGVMAVEIAYNQMWFVTCFWFPGQAKGAAGGL